MWRTWSSLQRHARPLLRWSRKSMPWAQVICLCLMVGGLWWFGPLWEWKGQKPLEALSARISATVVLLAIPLLIWAWRVRRHSMHIEALKKADQVKAEDPCLRYVQAQERHLDHNLTTLQGNLRDKNKLDQLPWYLVLGQEDAGKTTFIKRTGQRFTLTDQMKTGSSRVNIDPFALYPIDCWIGDEAVLMDVPGQLVSQRLDDPAHAFAEGEGKPARAGDLMGENELPVNLHARLWDSFVGWLGSRRSRRPLNGVVLVVSVVSLLNHNPDKRNATATLLRARLAELSRQLGTRPPLYVVLSKFDLLEGFETLFTRLPRTSREEVLGFSFTLDSVTRYDQWLDELSKSYDAFLDRLNEQVFDAMAETADLSQRESLYSLVRQLAGGQRILTSFLADVLSSDRYATPALPRGVYFSSVHQQGILNNAFIASAGATYGVPELASNMAPSGKALVYFAQHLFQRVIYPETGLANDNPRVIAEKKRALATRFGLASLGSALMIGVWYHHYALNRDKALDVLERSQAFSTYAIDAQLDSTGGNLLQPLDQISNAVAVYGNYRNAWPVVADFGLYQGREIGPKVDEAYLALLSQRFLPALARGVMDELDDVATDSGAQLAALRVYRMLEDRTNRRAPVVKEWMAERWQSTFVGEDVIQSALMRHLDYALKYADVHLPQFENRVAEVQRELRMLPLEQRVYMAMRDQAGARLVAPLDLRNEIGPAYDIVYESDGLAYDGQSASIDGRIDALLTAKGYRSYFSVHSEDFTDLALIDQWALGERRSIDYSEADKRALSDRIQAIYSRDYIDLWQRNLNHLEVRDFQDISQAMTILGSVISPAAPLRRLVETVRDNSELGINSTPVVLPDLKNAEELANMLSQGASADFAKPPSAIMGISRAFAPINQLLVTRGDRPSYLDETMQAIGAVQDRLRLVHDNPDRGKAALGSVLERFALKGPDPVSNLRRIAGGLPEPLNHQVAKLAEESAHVVLIEALRELDRRWEKEVYSFYQQRLANRYPFNSTSRQEASLDDFTAFFGPKGLLRTFREKYLDLFIQDNLEALYLDRLGGYLVREDVLDQLLAAEKISDAFFNSRGQLGVQFQIEPLGLAPSKRSSSLSVEGQLVTYHHGPSTSTALIWPNSLASSNESRMTLVNAGGSSNGWVYRGPWSFYRLLSQARLNGATSTSVDISFTAPDGGMRYRLTTDRANNPFVQPVFKGFALPRTLLQEELRASMIGNRASGTEVTAVAYR